MLQKIDISGNLIVYFAEMFIPSHKLITVDV